MLTEQQLCDALSYNIKRLSEGSINRFTLPWPWHDLGLADETFVFATYAFQIQSGLVADGKLGPRTVKRLVEDIVLDDLKATQPCKPYMGAILSSPDYEPFSNAVIVDGRSVRIPDVLIGAGVRVSNYVDDGEPRFVRKIRRKPLRHFVLHETCGNTSNGCINTLLKKNYGVQFIMAPDGHISCHGDLERDCMVHANQLNGTSIGIEVVNPYNPIYVIDSSVWNKTITAQWWTWVPSLKTSKGIDKGIEGMLKRRGMTSVPREYVVPTDKQILALRLFVPWVCETVGIPYEFPTAGLSKKQRKISGIGGKPAPIPDSGVVAHRDFSSHSDGRYLLEDLISKEREVS